MQEAKYQINQLFGSSYIKALMQVFPEIGLKEIKFRFAPSICFTFIFLTTTNSLFHFLYFFSSSFFPSFFFFVEEYWSIGRKRELFCQYARQHSFDPLVATNWHSISIYSILMYKVSHPFLLPSFLSLPHPFIALPSSALISRFSERTISARAVQR